MENTGIDTGILLETGTNELEILEFFISAKPDPGEPPEPCHFGVNVAKVMQVIESPHLEPSDWAPHPCFLGTIPLRDVILPVLDLSIYLGIERDRSPHEVVIVTEFSQRITGFLVSGVTEIHRVGWREVVPPSGYLSHMDTASLIGMVNLEDHFIQLLDLEKIIADLDPKSALPSTEATAKASRNYTALVADDSPTIRVMLRNHLQAANFNHHILKNGQEALEQALKIKAQAQAEDRDVAELLNIVIADIEMPLMDGFTLARNIKQDPVLKKLPVILYSSIITKELRHKGESVGADEQISKPDLDKLAERAIRLIEKAPDKQ